DNAEKMTILNRLYGNRYFRCRYPHCHQYKSNGDGFPSKQDRDQHEKTMHPTTYKCPKSDCIYHDVRLKSMSALKAHINTYHAEKTPSFGNSTSRKGKEPQRILTYSEPNTHPPPQIQEGQDLRQLLPAFDEQAEVEITSKDTTEQKQDSQKTLQSASLP